MAWLVWCALAAVATSLLGQLWSGLGPPWRWPALTVRFGRRSLRSARLRIRSRWQAHRGLNPPDPFAVLEVQRRLGALAEELQRLEADDADRTYWARAHRIQTRRSAYDQLLAEACKLAGVPGPREPGTAGSAADSATGPATGRATGSLARRSEEERFRDEMELASRGWTW
jgi:hypothetical protein